MFDIGRIRNGYIARLFKQAGAKEYFCGRIYGRLIFEQDVRLMENMNFSGPCGRADIHVHTRYSGFSNYSFLHFPDCVSDPFDVVDAAKRKGLDIVCITDHNTIHGACIAKKYARDICVVAGEEIATEDGEILALFISEEIRPQLSAAETIDIIHSQGGLAIAAHPFRTQYPALETSICRLKLDGVEAFNAYNRDAYSNLMAQMLSPKNLARLGGSDAHTPGMIGNGYTEFNGSTQEEFRKSILKGKVSFGGSVTPLSECMSWSRQASWEIIKMIWSSLKGEKNDDVLYKKIDKITTKSKVLGLVGAGIYLGLHLQVLAGPIGDAIFSVKSRHKWNDYAGILSKSEHNLMGSDAPGMFNIDDMRT